MSRAIFSLLHQSFPSIFEHAKKHFDLAVSVVLHHEAVFMNGQPQLTSSPFQKKQVPPPYHQQEPNQINLYNMNLFLMAWPVSVVTSE